MDKNIKNDDYELYILSEVSATYKLSPYRIRSGVISGSYPNHYFNKIYEENNPDITTEYGKNYEIHSGFAMSGIKYVAIDVYILIP